ncbi:MAG: RHS repeat-associated core domain-containing protein, partial [Nitrospira sp.]|nr:RHS repeat-associated core domain-containing protein [Nitrospira sp.]
SPGTVEQPYTYTGREFDSESGLYYYRARYYDPASGRFLQEDPMGVVGGDINLLRYVRNNPVNLLDPFGLVDKPPSRNIKPTEGDPLGDQLRKIDTDDSLSPKERKDKLEKIKKEIKKLPPGEHKRTLNAFLKVVKRFGTICLILEFLEEVTDPDTEQDPNAS